MKRITNMLVNAVLNGYIYIDVLRWYLHTFIGWNAHTETLLLEVDNCI